MDEKFIRNTELAVAFHRSLIRRARWWGITATILAVVFLLVAYLCSWLAEGQIYPALISALIPSIGWGWAWKEIYDFQKRIDAVEFYKNMYIGPPASSDSEKEKIRTAFEKIIDKNY